MLRCMRWTVSKSYEVKLLNSQYYILFLRRHIHFYYVAATFESKGIMKWDGV